MVKRMQKNVRRRRHVPRNITSVATVDRIFSADVAKIAGDSGLYRTFQPLLFPIADFIGGYTQYRIRSFTVQYQLYNQLNNNSAFPTLFIAPQSWSESATPASLSEVQQFKGIRMFQFGPSRPTYTQTSVPYVNFSTTGPGRIPTRSPWISTTSDLPQHLTHVDWLVNYNSTSATTHTIRLVVTAHFEFKNSR